MSNTFFRFKQFIVNQDHTAMKVGTDSVLLGGLSTHTTTAVSRILDVGTGTGVVALMLAQRYPQSIVSAIDIDPDAVHQATQNFKDSPFANRLSAQQADYRAFQADSLYDIIVSNPPFFSNSLTCPNKKRTLARHDDTLPLADLIRLSATYLSPNGTFSLILPYDAIRQTTTIAEKNALYPRHITTIFTTNNKHPKRFIADFTLSRPNTTTHSQLTLLTPDGTRTHEYIAALADFYL